MDRDQLIGENLQRSRGDRTQQWVADEMRALGHQWSQATVWSVEKGKRPLRLTEAQDLAQILGAHDAIRLLETPEEAEVSRLGYAVIRGSNQVRDAVVRMALAQRALREFLDDDAALDWGRVDPSVQDWAEQLAERSISERVEEEEQRLLSPEGDKDRG
jgi:hypothetical protein